MNHFVIWLFLGFSSQFLCITSLSYLVAPDRGTYGCSDDLNCINFTTFLKNSSAYIGSHSVLEFYPDLYSLETTSLGTGVYQVELNGLDNVTIRMIGEFNTQRAKFSCTKDFKLTWIIEYSTNIKISSIDMIECIASVELPNNLWLDVDTYTEYLPSTTTVLVLESTNITLANVQAYSVNRSVLFCVNTRENLRILSSSFQGSINFIYASNFSLNKLVQIHIADSIMIPGIYYKSNTRKTQQGITVDIRNVMSAEIAIHNCSFSGIEGLFGFLLDVNSFFYKQLGCPTFTVNIYNSCFMYGGITTDGCNILHNIISMENCTLRKMPTDTGFRLSATEFEINNTTFSESELGLYIHTESRGTLRNCKLVYCKNAFQVIDNSFVTIGGNVYFSNSIQGEEGFSAMLLEDSFVSFEGHTVIENTRGGKFAAIVSSNTTLYFHGDVDFIGNEGFLWRSFISV